jgi:hypothetical protein
MTYKTNRIARDYSTIFALIALLIAGACGIGPCARQSPIKRELSGQWRVENRCTQMLFGGQKFFITTDVNIGSQQFNASMYIFADEACKDLAAVTKSIMGMTLIHKDVSGTYLKEYEAALTLSSLDIEFKEATIGFRSALARELSCENTDITTLTSIRIPSAKSCYMKGIKITTGMAFYQRFFLGSDSLDLADFREQHNPEWSILLPAFISQSDAMKARLVRFRP